MDIIDVLVLTHCDDVGSDLFMESQVHVPTDLHGSFSSFDFAIFVVRPALQERVQRVFPMFV